MYIIKYQEKNAGLRSIVFRDEMTVKSFNEALLPPLIV